MSDVLSSAYEAPASIDQATVQEAGEALEAFIGQDAYPCVAAKSVFNRQQYRYTVYPRLGGPVEALAEDLYGFLREPGPERGFRSFLAVFQEPKDLSERDFERRLWQTLQALHDHDAPHHPWDPAVASDPDDPRFSFSFGGEAFYVVGMHPGASRLARRFAYPMLVFNLHRQFEQLRADKRYAKVKGVIRQRDRDLQGSVNPMLQDFGTQSAARQYAGRAVDASWKCPFHAHTEHAHTEND